MSSLRGAVHVVVAVAYIGLLAGALRLQWAARAAVRDSGGVAQLRLAGLVVIGLGLLIAAFTLWAGRHVVGAAVATALLTVVLAVQPPFRVSPAPQWVNDVLWNIGLLGDHTVVPLAWGAAVVALVVAVAGRRRRGRRSV